MAGRDSEPDVLVIGAGPSALTAATVLADHGVGCRVVGAGSGPTTQSRALVVQSRTLELWYKLGLADGAIRAGQMVDGAVGILDGTVVNHGRPVLNFAAMGVGQTPYPFLLVHEQSRTEAMLLERLAASGRSVDWNTRAVGLRQHHDAVEVTLRRADGGEETVRPRWVIGADGASSTVRHALGLSYDGGTYETAFFLADVAVDWELGHDQLYLALTDTGTFLFVPMREDTTGGHRFRILASLPPEVAAKGRLELADVQNAVYRTSGVRARVHDPRWISLYRLHHRLAEHFRIGRVFLAGDAAHIHSPVGGQGMNTGIQDAYNLAWKLALVVRGHAWPELLESYEAERMPVARALLHGTDRAFGIIVSRSRAVRLARRVAVHAVPRVLRLLPADARRLFAMVSQIGITYAGAAPAADTGGPVPRAGDRAPHAAFAAGPNAGRSVLDLFSGPGHHLLVLPAAADADLGAALVAVEAQLGRFALDVDVHVVDADETAIHRAYGARRASLALVRPDGHLAWRGPLDAAERLGAHLSRWYTTAEEMS